MINKVLVMSMVAVFSYNTALYELPKGWIRMGSEPKSYEMGIDPKFGPDGNDAATLKSKKKKIKGFGTLMQVALAKEYLGKRVRMSGMMKTRDVVVWAGFWLRVDGAKNERNLSFDNMKDGITDRSITGTTPWTNYSIVLDVQMNAVTLNYGALLGGTGQIWFDKLKFEVVPDSVPLTGEIERETEDWFSGDNPGSEYSMRVDSTGGPGGEKVTVIQSLNTKPKGFGNLNQTIPADKFRGRRVRMHCMVKTAEVRRWAGIWVRVPEGNTWTSGLYHGKSKKALMLQKQKEWTKYEVVFEVPVDAQFIKYGAQLTGAGQIWFEDIQFEIVDESVPLSPGVTKIFLPQKEPVNLDFEIKNE